MQTTTSTSRLSTPKRTGWWDNSKDIESEKLAVKDLLRRTAPHSTTDATETIPPEQAPTQLAPLSIPVAPAAEPPVTQRKKKKTKRPPWSDPVLPVLEVDQPAAVVEYSFFNLPKKVKRPFWNDPVLPILEEDQPVVVVESSFNLPKIQEEDQPFNLPKILPKIGHEVLPEIGSREDVRKSMASNVNESMSRQRKRHEEMNVDDILRQRKNQDDELLKQRKSHDEELLKQRTIRDCEIQRRMNLSNEDLNQNSLIQSRSRGSRDDIRRINQSTERLHEDSLILSKQKRKTRSNDSLADGTHYTRKSQENRPEKIEIDDIAHNYKTLSRMMNDSDFQAAVHFARYKNSHLTPSAQYSNNSEQRPHRSHPKQSWHSRTSSTSSQNTGSFTSSPHPARPPPTRNQTISWNVISDRESSLNWLNPRKRGDLVVASGLIMVSCAFFHL
jgi:hypothetical protein